MLSFISLGLYSLLFYLDKNEERTADGLIYWFSELLSFHHTLQVVLFDGIGAWNIDGKGQKGPYSRA